MVSILILFLTITTACAYDITSCQCIESPGYYELKNNLSGINEGPLCWGNHCLQVDCSDVVIDGNGYTLNGQGGDNTGINVANYFGDPNLTNITIKNIKMNNYEFGISFSQVSDSKIENSEIYGMSVGGIKLSFSEGNTIQDNKIFSNVKGIDSLLTENDLIKNNLFTQNSYAIHFFSNVNNSIIENNRFENNYKALYSRNSFNNEIINNEIIDSSRSGFYFKKSGDNRIYNNYFFNTLNIEFKDPILPNIWNIEKTDGTNIIRGPYLAGNYWAKPDGSGHSQICQDSDSDGICDAQYSLSDSNIDYFPLTNNTAPQPPQLNPFPSCTNTPTDPDSDGIYEDTNGNGRKDFNDIVLFFKQMTWVSQNEPIECFDFNGNGRIDFNDVVMLFQEM